MKNMNNRLDTDIKVGLFVITATALLMASVFFLGGMDGLFVSKTQYHSLFKKSDGLMIGTKVQLNGIKAGLVDRIEFDKKSNRVRVSYTVQKQFSEWVRLDSMVEVLTQGMLGDKYLSISAGSLDKDELSSGSRIPVKEGKAISEMIAEGGDLMGSLNRIAMSLERILGTLEQKDRGERIFEGLANTATQMDEITKTLNAEFKGIQMKEAVAHLKSILAKIDQGNGTVGALINDPALYDDAKSLIGGMNRNRIMRNLVRQTIRESEEQ